MTEVEYGSFSFPNSLRFQVGTVFPGHPVADLAIPAEEWSFCRCADHGLRSRPADDLIDFLGRALKQGFLDDPDIFASFRHENYSNRFRIVFLPRQRLVKAELREQDKLKPRPISDTL